MVLHRERGVSEEPAHMAPAGGAGAKEGRGPKRAPRAHGLAGKRPVVAACPPIRPQVVRNPSPNILLRKIKDRDGERGKSGSRIIRCGNALSAAVVASGHLQSDFMADAGVVNGGASTEVLAPWGNRGSSREGRQQSHPGQAQARRGVKQTCSDPDSSTPPPLLIPAIAQETRGEGKDDRAVNRM